MPNIGQIMQPFTGNGYVSIWVKKFRVGRKTLDNQIKSILCFVCLLFYFPLENISLTWRRHTFRCRAAIFGPRGLRARRGLFRATPAVTWVSVFCGLLQRIKLVTCFMLVVLRTFSPREKWCNSINDKEKPLGHNWNLRHLVESYAHVTGLQNLSLCLVLSASE